MELGKGSETHLCPAILTPKNLVPEITAATRRDDAAVTALEKAMHELKESVLTPFVTVEAIGLLFGFDMIGKTVAPQTYTRWRKRLHPDQALQSTAAGQARPRTGRFDRSRRAAHGHRKGFGAGIRAVARAGYR